MKAGEPSRTALITAACRGRASTGPGALCSDPFADALAGPEGRALEEAIYRVRPALSLYIALRTAFLDAQVRRFTSPAVRFDQVVLLGAGLDTRAARLAVPGTRFFEVDHPETQADKRRRVRSIAGYPENAATLVPCDFGSENFLTLLVRAGFDPSRPAVIVWEGVTMYLPEVAVRATLRAVSAGCEERTVIFFDHLPSFSNEEGAAGDARHAFVAGLGEGFVWGTDDALPLLCEEGFRQVRSVSFDEICLSLTGTYEKARGFSTRHLVLASRASVFVP
jgi:methyltransferase (TIGR00027 family)